MTSRPRFSLGAALTLVACGGRSTLQVAPEPGGDAGVTHQADAGACVNITLSSFDQSCLADSDCVSVYVGEICPDSCTTCEPNAAINGAGAARYSSLTDAVHEGNECGPCLEPPAPRCSANLCTQCPVGGGGPAGCNEVMITDAGTGPDDGGVTTPDDGGFTNDAGQACVEILTSDYDPSCQANDDCVYIETGAVCSGTCGCGGNTPVNRAGQARFEQAISGLTFADCPCIGLPPPVCVGGTCFECSGSPNDPPECGPTGG